MNEENSELLEQYEKVAGYLGQFMFIAQHRIPFEEWPEDLKAIAGINEEFLGPVTQDLVYAITPKEG